MTITVLQDVILSNQVIAQGVRGRQIRKNQRVRTANGSESINIVWDRTLREYDLGVGPLRRTDWQKIESLFEITDGGAYGFLLQDPKDGDAGTGGRVAATATAGTYQLYKRYVEPVSGRYRDRKITRPKASTLAVFVSGVGVTFGYDAVNGTISVAGSPTAGSITWTGQFYVPVHFMNDQIDWSMVVAGPDPDGRFLSGPTVTLQEVLE